MSKDEPADCSSLARSGAVSAAGPTTPTLMPFGCGLWYAPMMHTENMVTKKIGTSRAPIASRQLALVALHPAAAVCSFIVASRRLRRYDADLDVAVDLLHRVGRERLWSPAR